MSEEKVLLRWIFPVLLGNENRCHRPETINTSSSRLVSLILQPVSHPTSHISPDIPVIPQSTSGMIFHVLLVPVMFISVLSGYIMGSALDGAALGARTNPLSK